jgi:hypothetical protein
MGAEETRGTSRIRRVEAKVGAGSNIYLLECGHRICLAIPPYRTLGDVVDCPRCQALAAVADSGLGGPVGAGVTHPDGYNASGSSFGDILERVYGGGAEPTVSELIDAAVRRLAATPTGQVYARVIIGELLTHVLKLRGASLGLPQGNSAELAAAYRTALERQESARAAQATGTTGKLLLRTRDAPEANGRLPRPDERAWCYLFPLEDGRTLYLEIGAEGRALLERVFLAEMLDNSRGAPDRIEDGGPAGQ